METFCPEVWTWKGVVSRFLQWPYAVDTQCTGLRRLLYVLCTASGLVRPLHCSPAKGMTLLAACAERFCRRRSRVHLKKPPIACLSDQGLNQSVDPSPTGWSGAKVYAGLPAPVPFPVSFPRRGCTD